MMYNDGRKVCGLAKLCHLYENYGKISYYQIGKDTENIFLIYLSWKINLEMYSRYLWDE